MNVSRSRIRHVAKGAGAVVLGIIAIDLLATAATAVLAWGIFQK
jgi:hypothetical protein